MATVPTVILEIGYAPDSLTCVYTNPASVKTIIKSFLVTNKTAENQSLSFWKVPSGETCGDGHLVFPGIDILPLEHLCFAYPDPGIVLKNNGDKLYNQASVVSSVVVHIYGFTL